jgi:hypothetical protein
MAWAKRETSNTTKHTHAANFGKKVDGCPRCEELKAGAAPTSWNIKAKQPVYKHDCKASRCGIVCTYGEW